MCDLKTLGTIQMLWRTVAVEASIWDVALKRELVPVESCLRQRMLKMLKCLRGRSDRVFFAACFLWAVSVLNAPSASSWKKFNWEQKSAWRHLSFFFLLSNQINWDTLLSVTVMTKLTFMEEKLVLSVSDTWSYMTLKAVITTIWKTNSRSGGKLRQNLRFHGSCF